MSICIPMIFTPVKFNNNLYVDGGILNNFPFNYCDKKNAIGIRLHFIVDDKKINLINYFYGLLTVVFDRNIKYKNNENIININIEYDSMVDFNPDKEYKQKLLKDGYKNTKNICKTNINFFCTKFINNIIDYSINKYIYEETKI